MRIDIVTIFPGLFDGPFEHGIVRRAREAGLVQIDIQDLRDFTSDRHKTVDDRPFGGGEGMVFKPEPLFKCVEALGITARERRATSRESVILLSAQGRRFDQSVARDLSQVDHLVFLCGRYEGVDERVNDHLADRELSIGDYVLSGGELAAAVVVDAIVRLLPGALGNEDSSRFESFGTATHDSTEEDIPFSTCGAGGLLDYPHYTRPAEFRGIAVPEVLMGGNHEEIRRWRRRKALEKTLRNRPDLLKGGELTRDDQKIIDELKAET